MIRVCWCPYILDFTFEARTSRGSMLHKKTYFIRAEDSNGNIAYGEVPLFEGLSAEDSPEFEEKLSMACLNPEQTLDAPTCSSIAFGFESAMGRLQGKWPANDWKEGREGIAINGLIWMGDKELMAKRIAEKIDAGFSILKLKIGGIDFDDELDLLRVIRKQFKQSDLEIRLDANGSFSPQNALERLQRLEPLGIHSLEQPIRAGQHEAMAKICRLSPIDIALDEELIGMRSLEEKKRLIDTIQPQYIILKPALCGGFRAADDYISIVGRGRWWATSALESNIGLADIASWVSEYPLEIPQGLGTGMLYSNNISSPMRMHDAKLWYDPEGRWQTMEGLPWRQ